MTNICFLTFYKLKYKRSGGAKQAGQNSASVGVSGDGGDGYTEGSDSVYDWEAADGSTQVFKINGTANSYAGGGGGTTISGTAGSGGLGGGGNGGNYSGGNGTDGTDGTGGGAGGSKESSAQNGGSGVVIIRYV